MNFLFIRFPALEKKLPHVSLGKFPTPVIPLEQLGRELGICKLYLKNAKEILTFGATGSNHALATAVYAKRFNIVCTCMLLSQPNADYVARNLKLALEDDDFDISNDFFGEKYALFSKPGMEAVDLMQQKQGIQLEGTYTGKAMAALIHSATSRGDQNGVILFWNTYNAVNFSDAINGVDYKKLSEAFHRYFEEDVQPLDNPHLK